MGFGWEGLQFLQQEFVSVGDSGWCFVFGHLFLKAKLLFLDIFGSFHSLSFEPPKQTRTLGKGDSEIPIGDHHFQVPC